MTGSSDSYEQLVLFCFATSATNSARVSKLYSKTKIQSTVHKSQIKLLTSALFKKPELGKKSIMLFLIIISSNKTEKRLVSKPVYCSQHCLNNGLDT
jgi:hypothetical protein